MRRHLYFFLDTIAMICQLVIIPSDEFTSRSFYQFNYW